MSTLRDYARNDDGFYEWLRKVNNQLGFVHLLDLPDMPHRDYYDSGMEPEEVAEMTLENAGFQADFMPF